MNEYIIKLSTHFGGVFTAFLLSIPADIHRIAIVALWFFVIDTITGMVAGRTKEQVTSRKLRGGMQEKFVCYGAIIGLAHGLAFLAGRPEWASFGWTGVCLTEALSIVENVRTILRKMGKVVRPLSRFLDAVANWIDKLTGNQAEQLVATADTGATATAKVQEVPLAPAEPGKEEGDAQSTPDAP